MTTEPHLRETQQEIKETAIDDAEQVLIEKALAGEPWAVQFWLRAHAKHRGYSDKVVVEQKVDTSAEREAKIADSPIDLRKLTTEQLEMLAEIAEQHQRRMLDGEP
jgi:hypothetical protein